MSIIRYIQPPKESPLLAELKIRDERRAAKAMENWNKKNKIKKGA